MKLKKSRYLAAKEDLIHSLRKANLWLHLGWIDIQQRYRGSILGPFWITLSMVIFIGALGIVYTRLFHQDVKTFMPFLTSGMLVWTMISSIIIESADVFINSKAFIDNIKLPYYIYVFRLIWRNNIIFFHNLVVYVCVALFFRIEWNKNMLLFFPAFFAVTMLLVCIAMTVALLGSRFRDIPPVITSLIMLIFFVSPVTWRADMLGANSLIIQLNPLNYILDILRSPLLGEAPAFSSWMVCISLVVISFVVSFLLFSRYRSRIAYWV